MSKELNRDLGLYSTITISLGAMIGSGIFVLPGLGYKLAGPSIIIAYTLAGIIVFPSALSKAEMATAMPESGGTYLYIDRAMGPLYGTVAGIGAWFSLIFKSAFALVGLGAYLLIIANIPKNLLILVALGLASILIIINILGVKQTSRVQAIIVTLVLLSLAFFIFDGSTFVGRDHYHPFFKYGFSGLLAATGFVFVSYAGVTKIASVAEEVENPGRNIPIAIILSISVMLILYSGVVFVIVGTAPISELQDSLTPMALAANQFLGEIGKITIGVIAVLALVSMANAGIISSTRYPLAMSRDKLAPETFKKISKRFSTPIMSILFTGGILLLLILFVPVIELAKLASAFQILVFTFENVALIAFRESDLKSYEPVFTSPMYPYLQIFGIIASIVLLFQMGLIPLVGALGLIISGILWYYIFGKGKTNREGAALNAIRKVDKNYSVKSTKEHFQTGGKGGVMVATDAFTDASTQKSLLKISEAVKTRRGGELNIVKFEELPTQVPLSSAVLTKSEQDVTFENSISKLTKDYKFKVSTNEVVTHDLKRSIKNYTREHNFNMLIAQYESKRFHGELFNHDVDYFIKNLNSDIIFVGGNGVSEINNITVIGNKGPYTSLELSISDAIAQNFDAEVKFLHIMDSEISDDKLKNIQDYHDEISELYSSSTTIEILQTDDWDEICRKAGENSDIVIENISAQHKLFDVIFGSPSDKLIDSLNKFNCTVLLVHEYKPITHSFLRGLIEKLAY